MEIEIQDTRSGESNFGYCVSYAYGRNYLDIYNNNAKKIGNDFIISENNGRPFCITDNREAADNALYHLAEKNATMKLEKLQIKDLTTKLK